MDLSKHRSVMQKPSLIPLMPSNKLAWFVALIYSFSLWLIMPSITSGWQRCLIELILLADCYIQLKRWAYLERPKAIVHMQRRHDALWCIELQDGTRLDAKLCDQSIFAPHFLYLKWRCIDPKQSRETYTVILVSNSTDNNIYRRLRVWLNILGSKHAS